MNTSNTTLSYPLHVAAAMGDLASLESLLASETFYDINERDDLNSTPLHVAALLGHLEVVSFLISKGADVSLQGAYDQNLSALTLATLNGQTEIIRFLAQSSIAIHLDPSDIENALFYTIDRLFSSLQEDSERIPFKETLDIFSMLTFAQINTQQWPLLPFEEDLYFFPETFYEPVSVWLEAATKYANTKEIYDQIMETVNLINAQDTCYQTYLDAKFLLHVLPVDSSYYTITYRSLEGDEFISDIDCHGFMICFVTPFVAKEIDCYREILESKDALEAFKDLSETYHEAILFARQPAIFENSVMAYDLYQQGKTILLPTGWEGHAVNIILDPQTEYFIVANAGNRYVELGAGAHVYQMHSPDQLTPDLIYEILNNEDQANLEYAIKYQLALDEVALLEHPEQQYGNCAWYSHKPSIESLLYLHYLHEGYDEVASKSLAHVQYTQWDTYESTHCLENYFDHNPALSINVVRDILIDYHPSLFTEGPEEIDPVEYHRAEYLATVLATDQYQSDFYDFFEFELDHAKPELIDLFKSVDLLALDFTNTEFSYDYNNDYDFISSEDYFYTPHYYFPVIEGDKITA